MEIHIYRLSFMDAPAIWRVYIVIAGNVVYRKNFPLESRFEALRCAIEEYEKTQKETP